MMEGEEDEPRITRISTDKRRRRAIEEFCVFVLFCGYSFHILFRLSRIPWRPWRPWRSWQEVEAPGGPIRNWE